MASLASLRNNVVVVMMVAAAGLLRVSRAQSAPFNCDSNLVYPYWSTCWHPALYGGQEVYELTSALSDVSGSLAPEYDESNSTYYLRLDDVGARYNITYKTLEYRAFVTELHDVVFVNVDTGRYLGWRAEGQDELWLVETSIVDEAAVLQFALAPEVGLVCPKFDPTVTDLGCGAYDIVSYGTRYGLSPNEEDDATYFKLGSDTGLPFLLKRSTSSASA